MTTELLTVRQAANRFGHAAAMVKAAIEDGRIHPAQRRRTEKGRDWILLDPRQLQADHERLPVCAAVSCERRTLRASGLCADHEKELTLLGVVAEKHGQQIKALRAAIDMGRIRCVRRSSAGIFVRETEFLEDLAALPRCAVDGCTAAVLVTSRHCARHYNVPGLEKAIESKAQALHEAQLDPEWIPERLFAELVGQSVTQVNRDAVSGLLPSKLTPHCRLIARSALTGYRGIRQIRPRPTRRELEARVARTVDLHSEGLTPDEIAAAVGASRSTVCRHLQLAGIEYPRRRSTRQLSAAERGERISYATERSAHGASVKAIAEELETTPGVINAYLRSVELDGRPPTCEYCGKPFDRTAPAPRDPAFVTQRFCSQRCASRMSALRNQDSLLDRDLNGVVETAQRMDLRPCRVYHLVREGLLEAQLVDVPRQPRPVWGISDAAIERFEREWMRGDGSGTGYRLQWLTERYVLKQARSRQWIATRAARLGLRPEDVEAIERARVAARSRRLRRHNRGRKAAAYHAEWARRYRELELELIECWEVAVDVLGEAAGPRPGSPQIRLQLALGDWSERPDRWPRDGWPADPADPEMLRGDMHAAAADRVRTAMKRLQIERS
jgi:DNA-binding NarL/FixJ family response regulator